MFEVEIDLSHLSDLTILRPNQGSASIILDNVIDGQEDLFCQFTQIDD